MSPPSEFHHEFLQNSKLVGALGCDASEATVESCARVSSVPGGLQPPEVLLLCGERTISRRPRLGALSCADLGRRGGRGTGHRGRRALPSPVDLICVRVLIVVAEVAERRTGFPTGRGHDGLAPPLCALLAVRNRVDLRHDGRASLELVVRIHEQLPGLVVQRAFREWHDQEAADDLEDVPDRRRGLPVPLERVHADVPVRAHVRMEDAGQEEPPRRRLREVAGQHQLHPEAVPLVWRFFRPADLGEDLRDALGLFLQQLDSLRRRPR
eukprot:scaffold1638_cov258-Pinguiococcus_pyrenoidosus.AAC.66